MTVEHALIVIETPERLFSSQRRSAAGHAILRKARRAEWRFRISVRRRIVELN